MSRLSSKYPTYGIGLSLISHSILMYGLMQNLSWLQSKELYVGREDVPASANGI